MAEPFVFHFSLGDGLRPELLYIADIQAECGLCGHTQIQRFYHTTPFHELTIESFQDVCRSVHNKTDYVCENCGTEVGPDGAKRSTTMLGFADESGILRAYHDIGSATLKFRGVAPFRLDPQELPGFSAAEASGALSDVLTHAWFERTFLRVFNIKRAWADLIAETQDDLCDGWSKFAPGVVGIIGGSWEAVAETADTTELLQNLEGEFELIELGVVPEFLATHENAAAIYGGMSRWLSPEMFGALEDETIVAAALVSVDEARRLLERTFEVAQLRFTLEETDDDVWYRDITTPGEIVYERDVSIVSVLQRAVFTGITPGEAARLTAEEITGKLLRVF